MLAVRKTEAYAPGGWTACGMSAPGLAFWLESSGWQPETQEMRVLWAKGFRSCGSTTDRAIGSTSRLTLDRTVVVLLAGGDKRTQSRDIETALRLARNL